MKKLNKTGPSTDPWATPLITGLSAPVWVPHGDTSPAGKSAPVWAPLSLGPQVLPRPWCSTGCPQGHNVLWTSTCLSVGSYMGCRQRSAPPWISAGWRGTAYLTVVFITTCKLKLSAPALGAPPSLLTHWPWCLQSGFSHIFSLFSPDAIFFSFSTMLS